MRSLSIYTILIITCIWQQAFGQITFSDVAMAKGINHDYGPLTPGGGVSFYDFNHDGWDDLTFATINGSPIHFYKNVQGSFQRIIPASFSHTDRAQQVLWADYDNDGDADLFVTSTDASNRLYQNQPGGLNLVDVTAAAGLPMNDLPTYGAAWGDYDRDGWLDLYWVDRPNVLAGPVSAHLFHNQGDGTFVETTLTAMVADSVKIPWVTSFIDVNNDLWPDIYTAQDKLSKNSLFKNNGDGTFVDISIISGANLSMNSMSVTPGDFNGDGWLDIYITNTDQGNRLLRNNGDETFTEVADSAGVTFNSVGWGAHFFDLDNDQDLDLYVSGMEVGSTGTLSSACYENNNDGTFTLGNSSMGFLGDTVSSFANATGDFNRDGFPDIVVNNRAPYASQLWENSGNGSNQWLRITLQGTLSNRDGIGSWIHVFANNRKQSHYTTCGTGFLGQSAAGVIFGLGNAAMADSVIIEWPSGHIDHYQQLAAGQDLTLVENDSLFNTAIQPDIHLPLEVFPVPAGEFLIIRKPTGRSGNFDLYLRNFHGQMVRKGILSHSEGQIRMDLKGLAPGYYFLEISDTQNGQRYTRKVWISGTED